MCPPLYPLSASSSIGFCRQESPICDYILSYGILKSMGFCICPSWREELRLQVWELGSFWLAINLTPTGNIWSMEGYYAATQTTNSKYYKCRPWSFAQWQSSGHRFPIMTFIHHQKDRQTHFTLHWGEGQPPDCLANITNERHVSLSHHLSVRHTLRMLAPALKQFGLSS